MVRLYKFLEYDSFFQLQICSSVFWTIEGERHDVYIHPLSASILNTETTLHFATCFSKSGYDETAGHHIIYHVVLLGWGRWFMMKTRIETGLGGRLRFLVLSSPYSPNGLRAPYIYSELPGDIAWNQSNAFWRESISNGTRLMHWQGLSVNWAVAFFALLQCLGSLMMVGIRARLVYRYLNVNIHTSIYYKDEKRGEPLPVTIICSWDHYYKL